MRDRRTPAEAAALRDAVLDRWSRGAAMAAIATSLGVAPADVSRSLHEARRRGDPRAGFRYAVAGGVRLSAPPAPPAPPSAPSAPEPVVVHGHRAALLRACLAAAESPHPHKGRKWAILNAWAAGMEAPQIGEALGMRWKTVSMIVSRARAKGDPRAHRRQHDPADSLSAAYRVTLDRLDRRYGVTASIHEVHP